MTRTLPAGMAETEFDTALAELRAALGDERVITQEADLREYRDPYSYRYSSEFDASAVVTPVTTEQVQAVVRIANRFGIPLWTISQGRNNTYGGPAPRLKGSIIVSLREMNQVREIHTDLAYAVVEPGVRWFDLYDALRADGDHLWTSIPDLGWGSVIGNSLDYGIGYSPNGDHASMLCGLEVVLPDGEVLRTGFGAQEGNPVGHLYRHAFGPSLEGLFKQSNLGIVTRAGVWLMKRPEQYAACAVRFAGDVALGQVIDTLRDLMLEDVITNLPMFTRGLVEDAEGNAVIDPTSDRWSARFALYGAPALIDARLDVIRAAVARVAGADLVERRFAGNDHDGPANHDERVQIGIPDMDLLDPNLLPFGENTAHLDFSPIGPAVGADVVKLHSLVRDLYAAEQRPYVGGILLSRRTALQISTTFYDPRDKRQTDAVYEGYSRLVEGVAAAGYLPYRTNLQHMDAVAAKLDFGDGAQLRVLQALKGALDPNGIIAPGKQGVWPAGTAD
jgi:4-cresol dehydrogenase (hydroxylating)